MLKPALIVALSLLTAPVPATAQMPWDDDCSGFKWDVSRERSLFASAATPLEATVGRQSPPAVHVDRLYRLQMTPTTRMSYPVPPGKVPSTETYGAVLRLTVPVPGRYRLAVDAPLWIDVVGHGRLVPPTDFEGQRSCNAPRKIVEFELEGAPDWLVQLSGATQAGVGLVIVGAASAASGEPR